MRLFFGDKNSPNLDSAFSLVSVFFGNQVANSLFFSCQVGCSDFFVANFRHLAYNILEKKNSVTNSLSQKPKSPKNSQKISTTGYNMGQGVLKIFLLSYSEYH
jgi:hypothetical protein